jgi:F420-0:gamma-glutamyl ligase
MALGEEPVPQGILPGWVWATVQNEATLRKDYETLNKLTSENAMMQFATILGQNVQAFADKNPVSVVAITHEISKAAEKRLEEKYPGKKIKDIKQRQEEKLKESIKEHAPKVDEWSRFVDSLVCP